MILNFFAALPLPKECHSNTADHDQDHGVKKYFQNFGQIQFHWHFHGFKHKNLHEREPKYENMAADVIKDRKEEMGGGGAGGGGGGGGNASVHNNIHFLTYLAKSLKSHELI